MRRIMLGRKVTWGDKISKGKIGKKIKFLNRNYKGSNNPFYGKHHKPEAITKMKYDMRTRHYGSSNSHWRGGVTPEYKRLRHSQEAIEWRNAVFKRDNYVCRHCGYDRGEILCAHHILPWKDYPEYRHCINNGITLCLPCHREIHRIKED